MLVGYAYLRIHSQVISVCQAVQMPVLLQMSTVCVSVRATCLARRLALRQSEPLLHSLGVNRMLGAQAERSRPANLP